MIDFCNFILVESNKKENKSLCKDCDYVLITPKDVEPPPIPCRKHLIPKNFRHKIQSKSPSIFVKAINFTQALFKHVLSGGERTSPKERNRRLEICKSCEMFDGYSCTKCGCPITAQTKLISKLDWANQHCPIKKW